ncbi:MAG: flagellar basal body-associated FliL family protein [Moorellales bacterium]
MAKGIKLGGKKLVVGILVLVLVAGGAGYFVLGGGGLPFLPVGKSQGEEKGSTAAKAQAQELRQTALEPLVVNLADSGGRRYLRVTITLEYAEPRVEKELQKAGYKIRDAIIQALRSKTAADLAPDRAEQIRQELIETVNRYLETGRVTGLYFQEFIIQ